MRLKLHHGAAFLCALATTGCFVEAVPGGTVIVEPTGTVTVEWTIGGVVSSRDCAEFGASDLELVVYNRAGRVVNVAKGSCSQFSLTVPLLPGHYSANATLVDLRSNPVSRSLPLQDINIIANSDLTIVIDFPRGSRI